MSDHFEARECPLIRDATRAFVDRLLADLLPSLQMAAKGCGYALALHGSRSRDIDLVAVPWTSQAFDCDALLERIQGACTAWVGRAFVLAKTNDAGEKVNWTDKPHGRKAATIILPGMCPEIDLSVMPRIEPEKPE